jgi:hypothetical protein
VVEEEEEEEDQLRMAMMERITVEWRGRRGNERESGSASLIHAPWCSIKAILPNGLLTERQTQL